MIRPTVRESARERGRKGGQKEGVRVVICTKFDGERRQYPRLRRGNSSSLCRFCERGKEEEKEGIAGYLRRSYAGFKSHGVSGEWRKRLAVSTPEREGVIAREEGNDRWDLPIGEREGER
jgi:hypothetical protein